MWKKFDKNIDKILLKNGFRYWDDWSYGPMCGWTEDYDHITLKLMQHDYGYWIIFCRHASGENQKINLGESNNAYDIIRLRDMLKKVASGQLIRHNKSLNWIKRIRHLFTS